MAIDFLFSLNNEENLSLKAILKNNLYLEQVHYK